MTSPGAMADSAGNDITRTPEYHMYAFKILSCPLKTSHDWSSCSWAHPKEQARRRDPRRFYYTPAMCPYAKMGAFACPKGDACDMAHQVYEYWLHPLKFRSEMCRKGPLCDRRLCFFAHKPDELRSPTQEQLVAAGMMAAPTGAGGARVPGVSGPLPPMMEDMPMGAGGDGVPRQPWDDDHNMLLAAVGSQDALLAAHGGGHDSALLGAGNDAAVMGLVDVQQQQQQMHQHHQQQQQQQQQQQHQHQQQQQHSGAAAAGLGQRPTMLLLQGAAPLQHAASMDTHSAFSSSSALMQVGGNGSFTHGHPAHGMGGGSFSHPAHSMGGGSFTTPGPGMGGGSFTAPGHGMGGGSFTHPAHSMGGGSFTAPSHGTGGGSFTHPAHGMGGGSFTAPSHGMGGGSFTHPAHGMGGGSFTMPSHGMGGSSFTHPAHGMGGGSFTASQLPQLQVAQRQLSFGGSTSPAFALAPALQLTQASQGQAQGQVALLAAGGGSFTAAAPQYGGAAAPTHASLRTASFTSDTSSVASMDVAGHAGGGGSGPLAYMAGGTAGGMGSEAACTASAPAPVRSGSFQLRALTAQLQELTDAAAAVAGTEVPGGGGSGGGSAALATGGSRSAPRLHVVRALASALKNELSALAAGVGGRASTPSPAAAGLDLSNSGRVPPA